MDLVWLRDTLVEDEYQERVYWYQHSLVSRYKEVAELSGNEDLPFIKPDLFDILSSLSGGLCSERH